ncbi:YheC/YheD family protein [Paenibacillus spongiae]|uniref:YheC/YheD family protein n=1 Tax=Paenibacillus spongiae TaxID=2909671 RepID=A0ABY5S418_9BACL|nr:YheC/YheD family protein [Paenibacillus spongiae]UVI28637.1 YheC/YheD family protein [Paenibacillus spongiae]
MENSWNKGVFPYPNTIFARCGIPLESAREIEKIIGFKVFNTINFNKWEEWCVLNTEPQLEKHLPDTCLVNGPEIINDYLGKYNCVFLKPVIGSTSNGVVRAKYSDKSIDVVCTLNHETHRKKFATANDLWRWIRTDVSKANYVVQQRIRTVKWKKKLTGIRLNMAKDGSGKWENCLLIGLRALNGSHIAYSRGYDPAEIMIEIDSLLMELQKKGIHDAKRLKNTIIQLGMDICHFFDRCGYHVADIGIDLGIDNKGKIWIFEVNRRPYPYYNFPVYDKSITAPLEYAVHLAGQ